MPLRTAQPELSVSDASLTTSAGHNALYWIVAAGLLVSGAGATTMSLMLPSDDATLLWPRIIATGLGVLLTALSSAVIAYLLTRLVTVSDVERRYTGVLDRIARSLAHVHANLQQATAQRRSGAYSHEETFQEVILASASSVLAEFDNVTRLSGSISGAFRESKRDLDEVRNLLVVDPVLAQTMSAARFESGAVKNEPVVLSCPVCGSRVVGQLAMRAGWTSTTKCQNCRSTFNIHRKGDLTVYAAPPRTAVLGVTTSSEPAVAIPDESEAGSSKDEGGDVEGQSTTDALSIPLTCPSCAATFTVRYRLEQLKTDNTLIRICVGCACRYRVRVHDQAIIEWEAGDIEVGRIVGRRASHVLVACTEDEFPILASYPSQSGNWHAFCVSHQVVISVTRKAMREWMEENDPAFLAARLTLEREGGSHILTER